MQLEFNEICSAISFETAKTRKRKFPKWLNWEIGKSGSFSGTLPYVAKFWRSCFYKHLNCPKKKKKFFSLNLPKIKNLAQAVSIIENTYAGHHVLN